jgi:hypothetical protein
MTITPIEDVAFDDATTFAMGEAFDRTCESIRIIAGLGEYVSLTDVKTGINILGTLQSRLVVHMSRLQRPAQRRLLDRHHAVRKRRALGVLAPLIPM